MGTKAYYFILILIPSLLLISSCQEPKESFGVEINRFYFEHENETVFAIIKMENKNSFETICLMSLNYKNNSLYFNQTFESQEKKLIKKEMNLPKGQTDVDLKYRCLNVD